MKKFFDSFEPCLELREVIFLRQLPVHPHLVPALDIFLDPYTKKLHIAMEYMDGNLFQLMKAREGKVLEGHVVKSVLYVFFLRLLTPLKIWPDFGVVIRSCRVCNIFMRMDFSIATSSQKIFLYRVQVVPVNRVSLDGTRRWLHLLRLRCSTLSRLPISVWLERWPQSNPTQLTSQPDGIERLRFSSEPESTVHLWISGQLEQWPLRSQL